MPAPTLSQTAAKEPAPSAAGGMGQPRSLFVGTEERRSTRTKFCAAFVIAGPRDEGMMPEPAGRHNRSPGRKSWVDVISWDESGRTAQESRSSMPSGLCSVEVSSLKGLRFIYNASPALTCWARIVTPFGLRVDGSNPFAKAGIFVGRCEMPPPPEKGLALSRTMPRDGAPKVWKGQVLGGASRRY